MNIIFVQPPADRLVAAGARESADAGIDIATLVTGGAIATVLAALVAGFFGWRRAKEARQERLEDARRNERAESVVDFLAATLNLQSASTQLLADAFVGYEGMSTTDMQRVSQALVDAWQAFQAKAEIVRSKLAVGTKDVEDLADSVNGPVRDQLETATPGHVDKVRLRSSSAELASRLVRVRGRVVTLQKERGGAE